MINTNTDNDGTVRVDNNDSTVRVDDNQSTVRVDDNDSTVRVDSNTNNAIASEIGSGINISGNMQQMVMTHDKTQNNTGELFSPGQVIEINNKKYTIENIISTSSGEAIIYKVNRDGLPFVLKHYKISTPLSNNAKEVLKKIKDNQKDRIIKLFEFGRHNNQDYEIMEFAEGGTLDQYLKDNGPIKDVNKLKNFVGQINEGLEQLHKELKIIYQDLKPENVYFRDAQKTKLILADFGISSVMESNNTAEVIANATTVYAAPDLARIGNEKYAIVDPSVDYFAFGITMMHLWTGVTPFRDIPERIRSRQISDMEVEFPNDIPDDCKTLIQGLIHPLKKDRWGNQQVKKWLVGESLETVIRKTSITYEPRMFNDIENYTNPKELAALMDKYPDRGKQYLFNNILVPWIEKSGNDPLLIDINTIIKTYANDKDIALYMAIYTLDPTRPFITNGGKSCTLYTIADPLMAESTYYMEDLKKANSKLYLYMEAVEGSNGKFMAEKYRKFFDDYSPKHALALVYLNLQEDNGESITIGSKKYYNPEEICAETDDRQIELIKKAVLEEDSLFLVWLSEQYGDFFTSTNTFNNLPVKDKFFLLGKLKFLSYKEFDNNWKENALFDLCMLINDCTERLDLFDVYAEQELPFAGYVTARENFDWQPTALCYLVTFFNEIITNTEKGLELARFLIKHGADVNEKSGQGSLPLCLAVSHRNVPLVKLFLELGADPDKKDNLNYFPLMIALYTWSDNGKEKEIIAEDDRIAIANLLLDYKANVNVSDNEGRSPLILSIYFKSDKNVTLISRLLDSGADINKRKDDGYTPLPLAILAEIKNYNKSYFDIIELLLKRGAKTETLRNNGYWSPLMIAADSNNINAAELLLKYGAKKDFTDIQSQTAYTYAGIKKHQNMMKLLNPRKELVFKCGLPIFVKKVVSILTILFVFITMDILSRIISRLYLNFPVLLGVSILLSHLLTAYSQIAILGIRKYIENMHSTFNNARRSIIFIFGIPIGFPLIVIYLQSFTKSLPLNIITILSFPADLIMRLNNTIALTVIYIVLMAGMMALSIIVSNYSEKYAKIWRVYKQY